jgi:AcrR family transcriptional regulator
MGIQERKEREKERRRQQILVAAKNIFYKKGFNKTTMEDIASAAELSPGTLYLYFKNKDELFASLSLRILRYLLIRLEEVEKQKDLNSWNRLELLQETICDVYEFDPLMFVKMFHLQSGHTYQNLTPQLQEEIRELSRNSLHVIARLIEDAMDKKKMIKQSPGTLAEMIWAFFSGVVLFDANKKIIKNKDSDLKPALNIAFEIFLRGIQK